MPKVYYHGSFDELKVGLVLSGRGEDYENDWSSADFYAILEKYRPSNCLPHKDCVFMVSSPDDLDAAGSFTEWCSEVSPIGDVKRYDMGWSSRISELVGDGYLEDSDEVRDCAEKYWSGEAHKENSLFEYLVQSFVVLRCEPFETFEICKATNKAPKM